VNYELERIWKEAVVAYFKVLSGYFPGGTEETTKSLSQDSRSAYRDLILEPPEYEARVLTTRQRLLAISFYLAM
jgi:hypothetical protein